MKDVTKINENSNLETKFYHSQEPPPSISILYLLQIRHFLSKVTANSVLCLFNFFQNIDCCSDVAVNELLPVC